MSKYTVKEILEVDSFEDVLEKALQSQAVFYPTSIAKGLKTHSRYAYLVHWDSFDVSDRTWEPEDHFEKYNSKLQEFKRNRGMPDIHEKFKKSYPSSCWRRLNSLGKIIEGAEYMMTKDERNAEKKNDNVLWKNMPKIVKETIIELADFVPEAVGPEVIVSDVKFEDPGRVDEDAMECVNPKRQKVQMNPEKEDVKLTSAGALILFANTTTFAQSAGRCSLSVAKRIYPIEFLYKGSKYVIPPLFNEKFHERNADRTLLNDSLIEFYLSNWMYNEIYDISAKERFHVFNTFFFLKLKNSFHQFYTNPPRRSELKEHYYRFFRNPSDAPIYLRKEALIVPIHMEKPKHWFLVLIHNPYGAIRRTISDENDGNNNRKRLSRKVTAYVRYEDAGECRIIIMDSLCHSTKYKETLRAAHECAYDHLRLWLQMTAAVIGEELMCTRVRKIVCRDLPKQKNGVDCGIYAMAYAEYFTWFNTEWMGMPTDSLEHMKMEEDMEMLLASEEPRLRLDLLFEQLKIRERRY